MEALTASAAHVVDALVPIITLFTAAAALYALAWIRKRLQVEKANAAEKTLELHRTLALDAISGVEEEKRRQRKQGREPLGADDAESAAIEIFRETAADVGMGLAGGLLRKVARKFGVGKPVEEIARGLIRASLGKLRR